jgi:hypothetical protein
MRSTIHKKDFQSLISIVNSKPLTDRVPSKQRLVDNNFKIL